MKCFIFDPNIRQIKFITKYVGWSRPEALRVKFSYSKDKYTPKGWVFLNISNPAFKHRKKYQMSARKLDTQKHKH